MARKVLARWRRGVGVCMLLGVVLMALLNGGSSRPAEEAKTPDLPADLAKVPSDAGFLISGRIAELWSGDVNKLVPQKYAKQMNEPAGEFEKKFGLPLDQVERLSIAVLHLEEGPPRLLLFFVGTTKTYDRDNLIGAIGARKEEKYQQQTFYVNGQDWAVYPLGERALVYGTPGDIRGLIDHPRKSEGNLATVLRLAAGKHSAVFALNVQAFNDAVGDKLPGETEPFKPLLQARYGTLTVDLVAESRAEVKLTFASDKDAKAAVKAARSGLDLARDGLERGVEHLNKQKEMSNFVELLKQVQGSLKAVQVEQEGKTLKAAAQLKVDVATVGPVLIEVMQRVRESAARTQSFNNLKQIALAMHNYAATMGHMPAHATYDKNGKALLSWRVLLLPYIDQQALYNEFHFNEPWDSKHNKSLLAKMPTIYASPQDEKTLKEHTTYYQGFVGKDAFFEGKQGLRFPASIPDGTSNTFMFVEGSKAVSWTKPEDIPYDPAKPLPKLGRAGAAGFLAAMCDGSVRFCSHKITEKTLHLVIQRSDGMPIPGDF